ncbi:MAG: ABC transporter permease [Bacteroidales bacterium]|nr:ABC transporter permease [Bacteroidales bacterium]
MFRNYLVTALRNIIRNRIQSVIQVISLIIGITAFVLIGLYARNELRYDRNNENFDRIYRLEFGNRVGQPTAPGHQIKEYFSEVENVVRLVNWQGKDGALHLNYIPEGDSTDINIVEVEDFFWCDSTIFDVFTFNFVQGNPETALRDPNSVVLSESTARRIFGEVDPIGKALGGNWMTVTGIFEDIKNSHIEMNLLISMMSNPAQQDYQRGDPGFLNNYVADFSYITYLLLPENNDPGFVEERINTYFRDNTPVGSGIDFEESGYSLRPLKDIYFTTDVISEKNYCRHGNLKMLRILVTIAVFILLLAVINYVNLTTARASLRAKEVGIRKVAGSSKSALINQFLVESIVVAVFSFIISLVLVIVLLPGFNQLASADMDLRFIIKPVTWIIFIVSVILLGVVSGLYPAFQLTRYQPVESLYGLSTQGSGSWTFRRILLTFQFFISIFLVVGVLVIFRQLHYMKSADLGFSKESVINTQYYLWSNNQLKRKLIKQEFEQIAGVKGVAFSQGVMGGEPFHFPQTLIFDGEKEQVTLLAVDPDFLDLMEIDLVEGRNFSWDRPADYNDGTAWPGKCLINETGIRQFGLDPPVGTFISGEFGPMFEIIGVVKDIHFRSQHEEIEPCLYVWWQWLPVASIKTEPPNTKATLELIEEQFEVLEPGMVFEYTYLEDTYNRQYLKDEQTAAIIRNFAIIAILIACLGLFGLSSFMAVRRTKEIGLRKIMGASVKSLFLLLSREFLRWVTIAIILACPVSWLVMNRWLQSFAYHTHIEYWVFVVAAIIAISVSFLTVIWQSLKTARANPVDSLRYE